jgi:thiol-disulfide isomerase/thioredoxin
MQFLNLNKPFVFAALCDCPRDQEFIVKMRQVEDLLRQGLRDGFSDRFVFLWSLPQTSDRFQVKSVFALTDKDLPALVIDNIPVGANVEKYRFEPTLEATRKEFSAQDVIDFLSDFLRQKLKLLVRSAPIPTQDNVDQPGKVIEVVADTFEKIILDQDHTYLVLIYSPSCGGSIAVQPIMQQLAEEIKNNPELRVARFDGTVNDVPVRGLHYHHYPTAFLFLKNQKFKEDGSINALDWDDFNGSKEMHSRNVPVILLPFKSHRNSILTLKKTLWSSLSLRKCRVNTDTSGRPLVA